MRLLTLAHTPVDPFYDAAVRSMGTSWHAFLTGAFEPSAGLAIDKPPIDLWLQVASTQAFGFGPVALLLPAALGGTLTVVALYDLLHTLAGRAVALTGAFALAVLPVAVITARSDTMDSVMAALLVGAFAVAARGLRSGRHGTPWRRARCSDWRSRPSSSRRSSPRCRWRCCGGAAPPRRGRSGARAGAAAIGACLVVALAWLAVTTVAVPAAQRPWAFGSTNGSAWNAAFVYDGWDRLAGGSVPG